MTCFFGLLCNYNSSGLLTSYVTIKYTNGEYRNFKSSSYFLLRYLRLTPQLGVFLLLTSLLPPLFDGPLWQGYMSKLTDRCYTRWWLNVLYLQNIIDIENIVSCTVTCMLYVTNISSHRELIKCE